MLRSDEILNSLNAKIEQAEICIDLAEKEELINQAQELKKDYKKALEEESLELKEIENKNNMKGEVLNMEINNRVEREQVEREQFLNYIKGIKNDMGAGNTGVLIPETVANRIIKKIVEISPIVAKMNLIHEGGDLVFIREKDRVAVGYQEEGQAFTGGDASFETVKLTDHVIGALTKISKSLINRSSFDIVKHVEEQIAEEIAKFLEKEALNGGAKIKGLSEAKIITAGKLDCDALIDAQMAVPAKHQANAVFVMHPNMLKALRKEKDNNARPILNPDVRMAFGLELLGKEVIVSDVAPEDEIIYGDLAGCYCKVAQKAEVEVLRERFADAYQVGVIGYVQCDMRIVEVDAIVKIVMS